MDFVTISLRLTSSQRFSSYRLALVKVVDNAITEKRVWNYTAHPESEAFFVDRLDRIGDYDSFADCWAEIEPYIANATVVAHVAGFHVSALRAVAAKYNIELPPFDKACTYLLSKKFWKGLMSYDMLSLSFYNGIDMPQTHNTALDNAEFTAKLGIMIFEKEQTQKIPLPDEENIFFGKNVVFTGAFSSLTRAEAQKIVADIGGIPQSGVNAKTDFLIVGQQDFRIVGADGMSSKQEKAAKLLAQGQKIEVMSESDFLHNV